MGKNFFFKVCFKHRIFFNGLIEKKNSFFTHIFFGGKMDSTLVCIPNSENVSQEERSKQSDHKVLATHTKKHKTTHKVEQQFTAFHPDGSKAYTTKSIVTDISEEVEQKKLEQWWIKEKQVRESRLKEINKIPLLQLRQHPFYQKRNIDLANAMDRFHQERYIYGDEWQSSPDLFAKICFCLPGCWCLLHLWPIETILAFGFDSHFRELCTQYTNIEIPSLPFFFLTETHITHYVEGCLLKGTSIHTKAFELSLDDEKEWFSFNSLVFPEDHCLSEYHSDVLAIFDYNLKSFFHCESIEVNPNCLLDHFVYIPVHGLQIQLFPSHIKKQITYAFQQKAMMPPKNLQIRHAT